MHPCPLIYERGGRAKQGRREPALQCSNFRISTVIVSQCLHWRDKPLPLCPSDTPLTGRTPHPTRRWRATFPQGEGFGAFFTVEAAIGRPLLQPCSDTERTGKLRIVLHWRTHCPRPLAARKKTPIPVGEWVFSVSKKCLAEFAAVAANKVKSIFDRGVYLGENTYQAASVEFVRHRRTNYARSRLQKPVEKPQGGFLTV